MSAPPAGPIATFPAVTCMGCGCLCDDIEVHVADARIAEARNACALGVRWFGDGRVPELTLVQGARATLDAALGAARRLLADAHGAALVYLAPDVTSEAQRRAIAVADISGAAVDGATSEVALAGILAGQRRGRAASTLGEIRNRADVVVFWACDPAERYPRYRSRYAVDPAGAQVPDGRAGRTLVGVSVGPARAPADADIAVVIPPEQELAALAALRALVLGTALGDLGAALAPLAGLAERLRNSRYVALVHDGEPGAADNPGRAEGLIALTQALNTLRAGGNRNGAEATLVSQTGYPAAVDFSAGHPAYGPERRGIARAARGEIAGALVVGSIAAMPPEHLAALKGVRIAAIGPRASDAPIGCEIVIDTGIAGIHEAGTGYRLDDVPLPLTPPLRGRRGLAETLGLLLVGVTG
jgi:formylmethanofuran dehydrogenase subunit B